MFRPAVVCLMILLATALIATSVSVQVTTLSETRAETIGPTVSVIDGDTLQVDGQIVQIHGIDAPELGQRCLHDGVWGHCGIAASFELHKLIVIEQNEVRCEPVADATKEEGYECLTGHDNIAVILLEAGYVIASEDAPPGYLEAEDSARQARYGLWHSNFLNPAEWRAGRRLPQEPGPEAGPCPIKGVIAADGSRLYYVPTDGAYDSVSVDETRGEKFFCSDEDARQAGWQRDGETGAKKSQG